VCYERKRKGKNNDHPHFYWRVEIVEEAGTA